MLTVLVLKDYKQIVTERRPSKLLEFLERINRAAVERGKKTELAACIGASRQQVNAWLQGEKMPGGEVTLRMLDWVQAEEAKQKETLPACNRRQGRKTRSLKSNHEKSKQVRKRK